MVRTSCSVWLRGLIALGLLVATTLIWTASAPSRPPEGQAASPLAHVYFFGRKLLKAHERFWQLVTT
jgi:hypothetical protein